MSSDSLAHSILFVVTLWGIGFLGWTTRHLMDKATKKPQ